jgi:hypothetical protein
MAGLVSNSWLVFQIDICAKLKESSPKSATSPSRKAVTHNDQIIAARHKTLTKPV